MIIEASFLQFYHIPRPAVTFDLQNVIRSTVEDNGSSLQVSSRFLKQFMKYGVWTQDMTSTACYDLELWPPECNKVIRRASDYSLSVLWKLFKLFMRYRGNEQMDERDSTSTPSYLHRLLQDREDVHNLRRRSATPALFTKTTMAKRAFRCTAPAIWNSLPKTVLDSDTVTSFKSRLKTYLFYQAFSHTPTDH